MHVPAVDDGAEAEAIFGNGEELLLGHELSTQDAIDIHAGYLDLGIIDQNTGECL